jgi:acyl carrier protein
MNLEPHELEERVWQIIATLTPNPDLLAARAPQLELRDGAGIDSLGFVSLMFKLEEALHVNVVSAELDFSAIRTVADVIRLAQGANS